MHWLRIDRYYSGLKTGAGLDDPDTHFQPVPCMHCEDAPCEVGCPVEATLHDHEGLNLMVYNRCVGTRACSGYCPYKVRHFNYLDYTATRRPSHRSRSATRTSRCAPSGVMEKCTYCVQRIAEARIAADKTGHADRRRRGEDRLPGRLPDPGHHVRRPQRPGSAVARRAAATRATTRCSASSTCKPAHHLPRRARAGRAAARQEG